MTCRPVKSASASLHLSSQRTGSLVAALVAAGLVLEDDVGVARLKYADVVSLTVLESLRGYFGQLVLGLEGNVFRVCFVAIVFVFGLGTIIGTSLSLFLLGVAGLILLDLASLILFGNSLFFGPAIALFLLRGSWLNSTRGTGEDIWERVEAGLVSYATCQSWPPISLVRDPRGHGRNSPRAARTTFACWAEDRATVSDAEAAKTTQARAPATFISTVVFL